MTGKWAIEFAEYKLRPSFALTLRMPILRQFNSRGRFRLNRSSLQVSASCYEAYSASSQTDSNYLYILQIGHVVNTNNMANTEG